jgi:hypothetical protein
MKKLAVVLVALTVLALVGCGPSAEQKKMVADLTTEVTTMVNSTSAKLGDLDNVAGQITSAISGADSLAMKFPKDTASIMGAITQLKSAKDRVMSVKENVSAWVSNFKAPDLTKMKFDEVLTSLKKSKDELTSAGAEVEGAMTAATTALDGYKGIASGLMTKLTTKKK